MFPDTSKGNKCGPSTSTSSSSSVQLSQQCCHFEFNEIIAATESFDEALVVGKGGFGKVYKGKIFNGSCHVVSAIKRLDSMSNQGEAEFWAEVEMLSKLRHCNLVTLIGYCNYEKEMILVYEYIPHGTLEDHLHKLGTPLSWLQRLKICIGAGRGLHYLHTGTGIKFGVIHRDVKSSNILLDESWAAKISDFGLSKIGPTSQPSTYVNTLVKGTFGYLDPNYFTTGRLTRKSDVYAFGVVLLEVLCRKRAVDKTLDEEQWGLATWAQDFIKEGNFKHIIDSELKGQISPKCLKEFAGIVERCLHNNPKQRPTMAEVVVQLESLLTIQDKTNRSLQATGKKVFGRMFDMFHLVSNGGSSGIIFQTHLEMNGAIRVTDGVQTRSSNASKILNDIKRSIRIATELIAHNTTVDVKQVPADFKLTDPILKRFKFSDLEIGTKNFSQDLLLGKGYFGEVFLGWIDAKSLSSSTCGDGIAVAVKRRCIKNSLGYDKCLAEVSFLGQLNHPNIVSLLGYCKNGDEYLLVYEYIENRTLDVFLFTVADALNIAEPLSWVSRLKIMIGVARGLGYLHSKDPVICGGVQSSHILLDQDFNAKLIDFGLEKSSLRIKTVYSTLIASHYIIDPEYMRTGHYNVKSDIYGLGVVLLEILTALPAIGNNNPDEQYSLVQWARQILSSRRNLTEKMDERLKQNYPIDGSFQCGALALKCVANNANDRPTIEQVLQSLEYIYMMSVDDGYWIVRKKQLDGADLDKLYEIERRFEETILPYVPTSF
ncbi:receptor like protein kinase S.2-like [Rutidosis leptorrhynchoides]|uniref:receptor like protein kinase S.2-like n=1 Tax=Rutidosis leptorrhynchoides TaxID=125765 RepID=UPI003A99C61E